MQRVGSISSLWRYPISSVGGESLSSVKVGVTGIVGDRRFCLIDLETGEIAQPETSVRWRPALFLQSSIDENGVTTICLPNGAVYCLSDPYLRAMLQSHFGFAVGVGRHHPPTLESDLDLPIIERRYAVAPLHLLTSASIGKLQTMCAEKIDERRFRPSLFVDTGGDDGFLENGWESCRFKIGDVQLTFAEHTKRCGMTFIAQPDLNENPEILRTIVRQNQRKFGIYCEVGGAGTLSVGMDVCCLQSPSDVDGPQQ
ncbi:MOSC domain-containing protein [Agrobacterium larrymoorei]|uniref:MOSC domain-containing protein n=1 Tax=Agrobacterium larrymoorei TaxID=160699 RepID=UPI001571CEBE|nr:MOSC N-terminal beta barrel domain-containing protein [Agrobacterium larrymoorei]NTJ44210.1 MOSC domain-containing protein [Agrobacterium larrymoorei]